MASPNLSSANSKICETFQTLKDYMFTFSFEAASRSLFTFPSLKSFITPSLHSTVSSLYMLSLYLSLSLPALW